MASLLKALLDERLELSHDALDAAQPEQAARLLREQLVDVGVLEPRDAEWAAFDRWLDAFLVGHPNDVTKVLVPFCRWEIPATLRLSIRRYGVTDQSFGRARRACRSALDFLSFLDERGIVLADASQADLEAYLEINPHRIRALRVFFRWLRSTRRAPRLRFPPDRLAALSTYYTPQEHRNWLARFTEDDSLSRRARITGLLVATTGRPASAVAKLKRSQLVVTASGGVKVALGKTPIETEEPLASLLKEQLSEPRQWDLTSDWLFPARFKANGHADDSSFVRDLQVLGCSIVALRGAAMLHLASALPLGPLRDLTGVSLVAARRWQEHAAAAFERYPALRIEERVSAGN